MGEDQGREDGLHAGLCMIYINQNGDPRWDLKIL